jgi:hypothetical protein
MKGALSIEHDSASAPQAERASNVPSHPLQRQIDGSPRQRAQHHRLTQLQDGSARQRPNGLPSQLRAGIEALSGMDMGNVVVHRDSAKPAQLNALAYAQGNHIHLGPGQEQHLPHEAWHVVQQRQGRVKATGHLGAAPINDDAGLEREADSMGSKAFQMKATHSAVLPIQRYPVYIDDLNGNDKNPGILTDSKHDWMRMIKSNLGPDTFELLELDGRPSGSLMIWEREYDQYRFSPDGQSFDDAMFPPHFMEEITGDDKIADDIEEPLYSYVGEYGVGYRPAYHQHARIELSGLISCIGFVLESENAGFACHMVVTGREPQDEGVLKRQVNALVAKFTQHAGERPEVCHLMYDETTYNGRPQWLAWMKPDGMETRIRPVHEDYRMGISGHEEDRPTIMWRGNPIRY